MLILGAIDFGSSGIFLEAEFCFNLLWNVPILLSLDVVAKGDELRQVRF